MLSFTMMSENDLYNADQVTNKNFRYLAQNVLPSQVLSRTEFDALASKASDKLYVVLDTSGAMLYLGELPISGSGGSRSAGTGTALATGTIQTTSGTPRFLST